MIETVISCLCMVTLLLFRDAQQTPILVAAFAFRILLSIVHVSGIPLPDSQFDARAFEHFAWIWGRDGRFFDDFTMGSYFYSWLGSGIYLIFGRRPFLLHVVNSYFGTLSIYFIMRSARLLSADSNLDRKVGWILAFYPSVALYSVLTMRESPIVFALSISIYMLLRWITHRRIFCGLGALLFMIVAQIFHAGMVGGTVGVAVIYLGVSLRSITVRDNLRPIALFVVAASAIGLVQFSIVTGIGIEKFWGLVRDFDIGFITEWQARTARGRGAYLAHVEIDTWLDLLWNAPFRMLFLIGTPFVWMVSEFRDVLGFLDALVFLFLVYRILLDISRRRLLLVAKYLSVALVIGGILALFALGTSNYGTAFRHRAKVFPWLLLLYFYGSTVRNQFSLCRRRCLGGQVR
jgi:hypothetical protein